MTSVQRKRLKRFIEFLRKVKTSKFDLRTVCETSKMTKQGEVYKALSKGCGTTACAFGYLPVFNPTRFRFSHYWGEGHSFDVVDKVTNDMSLHEIINSYFGIDRRYIGEIFYDDGLPYEDVKTKITPKMVAKQLQKVLDGTFNTENDND